MPSPRPKPLARSLGEFVGHIWRAVKADPSPPRSARAETRRETSSESLETPAGPVTLRRTTIEEIELPPPAAR